MNFKGVNLDSFKLKQADLIAFHRITPHHTAFHEK